MVKQRDSNIELLRIVLMSMIVLTHLYVHGVYDVLGDGVNTNEVTKVGWLVLSIIDYHVVCFFFISGYYGIKTNANSLVMYMVKICFYGILTYLLYGLYKYGFEFRRFLGPKNVMMNLSPFTFFGKQWWFAESYFYLMIVAPFLNKGSEAMKKRVFIGLLVLLATFSFFGKGSTLLAIMVYLFGRYLNKYPMQLLEDRATLLFIFTLGILLMNAVVHVYILKDMNLRLSMDYSSPVVLFAGISFFFVFKKIKMGYFPLLNWIASGVFGVYLLTDGFWRTIFTKGMVGLFGSNVLILSLLAISVTLVLAALDGGIGLLLNPLSNYLSSLIRKLFVRNTIRENESSRDC